VIHLLVTFFKCIYYKYHNYVPTCSNTNYISPDIDKNSNHQHFFKIIKNVIYTYIHVIYMYIYIYIYLSKSNLFFMKLPIINKILQVLKSKIYNDWNMILKYYKKLSVVYFLNFLVLFLLLCFIILFFPSISFLA